MLCQPGSFAQVNPPQKLSPSEFKEPIWLVQIVKRTDSGRVDLSEKMLAGSAMHLVAEHPSATRSELFTPFRRGRNRPS